jgi:hypothetical protein
MALLSAPTHSKVLASAKAPADAEGKEAVCVSAARDLAVSEALPTRG